MNQNHQARVDAQVHRISGKTGKTGKTGGFDPRGVGSLGVVFWGSVAGGDFGESMQNEIRWAHRIIFASLYLVLSHNALEIRVPCEFCPAQLDYFAISLLGVVFLYPAAYSVFLAVQVLRDSQWNPKASQTAIAL